MAEMRFTVRKKVIAWVLTICLIITLVPELAFATTINDKSSVLKGSDDKQIIEKSEEITVYDRGRDKKEAFFYGGQVRYEGEKGEMLDYDSSLVEVSDSDVTENKESLKKYAFKNRQGDSKQYIPENLSDETPILMENGEYQLQIVPTKQTMEILGLSGADAELQKEKKRNIYGAKEEATQHAVYEKESGDYILKYTSGVNGIKETIIINEKPENNVFEYRLSIGNLIAKENDNNEGISIYDEKSQEIVATISAPWMNDNSGDAYSSDITYTLKEVAETKGEYIIIMTIDEEYLADEARKYPVVIDPTITWAGSGQVTDTYVFSGAAAEDNFYNSSSVIMPVGTDNSGTYESYMQFANIQNVLAGKDIINAELTVYEVGNTDDDQTISLHKVNASWNINNITYQTKPACAANPIGSVVTTQIAGAAHTFDVTDYMQEIASGDTENYGLVLKNSSNSSGYTAFHSSRCVDASYRPALIITYEDTEAQTSARSLTNSAEETNADTTPPTYESMTFKDTAGESINNRATGEANPIIEFAGVTDESISNTCITYALTAAGTQPAESDFKTPAELTISSSKPYSGSFRLVAADRSLATGEYTLHVKIKDDAANETIKTFKYIKDIDDPLGSIFIFDMVTGNSIDSFAEPVNIEVGVNGTGSAIEESSLKLYKATTDSAGNVTGVVSDSEVVVAKNFTISENIVFDTMDICDGYGVYRFVLNIKDSVGRTKTVTRDVLISYTLPAPEIAEISHSQGGPADFTWKFTHNSQQKIKLGTIMTKVGESGQWQDAVTSGDDGYLPFSGNAQITVPNEEGVYDIYIKGEDTNGVQGDHKIVSCVVDKTSPMASITRLNQGYLMGWATDDNLESWEVYAKAKTADSYPENPINSGTYSLGWVEYEDIICYVDFSDDFFTAGDEYTLKLVAKDKAGNTAQHTLDITAPTGAYVPRYIAPELEVDMPERTSIYGWSIGTNQTSLSLKGNIQGAVWYFNNKRGGADFKDTDGNMLIGENWWNDIVVIKDEEDGTRKYSVPVVENGWREDITFSSSEIQGNVAEKEFGMVDPAVAFRIETVPGVATYQIQTSVFEEGEYVTIQPGTTYYVSDITPQSVFTFNFKIKATAEDGKNVNDANLKVYLDMMVNYAFLYSEAENYAPSNLRVEDKINHKTYLKWDTPETIPDDIYYQVYRSTEEDFVPTEENLVATDIKAGYFTEMNLNYGKAFYYKVCAVYEERMVIDEETVFINPHYSSFSEQRVGQAVDQNEFVKRIGMKEFWEFTEFNTPNGNGYIEKSKGNFLYQQKDAEIPNEGFDVTLTRAYNSQSSSNGTFGYGWSHDYDIELLNICENDSLEFTHVVLKDGNGTIYHFTRSAGDEYFVSSLGSYVNLAAENTEQTKNITISGDENGTRELKYQFILSTKDGVQYYFNSGGQLILMEDANDKFVVFERDASKGVLSKMLTNNNIAIEFIYNDGTDGTDPLTVKEIRLPDGTKVEYEYSTPLLSGKELLTKVTEVSDTETIEYEYEYDKALLGSEPHNLTKILDAQNKNQYKINYDFEDDQVTDVIYPNDEKFTFTYAPDNTCTVTKKISDGQFVLGEKDFFDRISGECEKSIRGVTDEAAINGSSEAGLDVTTYEYRDHLLVSSSTTAEYYEVNTDGYVVEKSGIRTKSASYSGDNPTKEIEEDGAVSEYTYYTEADGAHLDDLIKTVKETNASGKLASYKKYTYDTAGNVTEVVDFAEKTKITNSYYTEGAFKGELHTMKEYFITVTGTDQISSESLKSTSVYSYQYTTSDGVATKTENCTQTIPKPDGTNEVITTSTQYDLMGRVLKETDSRGYQTINTYDGFGRVTGTTYKYSDSDQLKQQTQTSYDKNGMVTYEKLENGIEKWYTYDNMGRVVSTRVKKDTVDETINTTYRYEDVNVYRGKGSDTVTINNAYVTKQAYADGTVISEIYEDHCGNVVRAYEGGLYTDMTYSSQGDMITMWCMGQSLSATEGILEIYIYDEQGNLTESIADPDYVTGTNTTGYYVRPDGIDDEWNTIQGSIVNKSRYDEDGNVIEQIDPLGNSTKYTYDKNGSLLSVLLPNQAQYEYQYDVEGSNNTTMDIVLEPRVTGTESDRLMSKSIVVKDSTDKTIKVEDLGTSDSDNTSISTTYEYDVRDNLIKATEKNGNYKSYTYDARDRVTAIDYYEVSGSSAAKTLRTEFAYDDADNLTVMVDKEIVSGEEVIYRYTAYGYDGLNRLVWVSENDTNTIPTETAINPNKVSYGYDGKDRLVSIDYANSNNGVKGLKFTYNTHGWLTKVDAVNANNAEKTLREYTYADDGMVSVITDYTDFLSGTNKWLKRTYTYDKFNRVTAIDYTDNMTGSSTDIKENYSYEYDKNNNIIAEVRQNTYGQANGADYREEYLFEYDANNRLIYNNYYKMETAVIGGDHAEVTYNYDAAGNKISEEVFKAGAMSSMRFENTYTYNEFNQLTDSYEENLDTTRRYTYSYDQNGNQTSKTTINPYTSAQISQTTYAYDAANRLKTATETTGETVDYTQENKYNGFGQRVEKKEGTDVTNYFYDGSSVLYTTDADDAITSFNLIGAEDNILSTSRVGADNQAGFYVYTKDIRESTTNVIGTDGLAEVSYTYDEFGETTEYQQDEDNQFYNEICYTAGVYDATTGLYNLNARYYSPAAGTFLTQDTYRGSLSRTSTLNYYAYCAGNPISYTDPSGHAAWAIAGAALGAYDGYKFAQKKGYTGWKKAAAIVGGAVIGAVNPFKVVKAAKTVAKVVKASKYTKAATSTKKAATVTKKVTAKPKQTVVAKKQTQTAVKTSTAKKTSQAVKTEQKTAKAACFTAGTKIHTEKGFKNIEAIKVGDYVWSENPETKEKALKKVKKIFVREKDSIIRLAINGETIETTDEHPFYVEGRGFTEAKWLKAGDEVRLATGNTAEVDTIESVQLDTPVKVYNFEVEDFHTYYVSEHKVLVHNTCAVTEKNYNSTGVNSSATTPSSVSSDPEFEAWLNKGNNDTSVYFGVEGGIEKYVGITRQNLETRRMQHNSPSNKHRKNFSELREKFNGLTRNQARAIEQYYIEMENGPNELNLRNSISPNHKFYNQAKVWAKGYIESH